MAKFQPDYQHLTDAAWNRPTKRLPLYEHNVDFGIIDKIQGSNKATLIQGGPQELDEFFSSYCNFFATHGYDAVTFECCVGQILPGGGALGNPSLDPVIKNRDDFDRYPWDSLENLYFEAYSPMFQALGRQLPAGMKAVGGVGNGVFECVQELTGFENLCYIAADDPELYQLLFQQVGKVSYRIWERFLREFGETYCVLRFGDDLGYKSNTMLSAADIREFMIPQYARIIQLVHQHDKPFLLHSCGKIQQIMPDLIQAGINAKHSNEDQIARFPEWVKLYGNQIGNFGGIDTDAVCRLDKIQMREYIIDVLSQCQGKGGIAFGSGNSIPDYVPPQGYLNMIEIVRELRGDF